MDNIELLVLQYLAQLDGEGVADIALHMVAFASEQGAYGRQGFQPEVDIDRLEGCALAVVVGQLVGAHGMLVGGHGEHLDLTAVGQQALGDAVHRHRTTVDRRIGGLVAKLKYLHK